MRASELHRISLCPGSVSACAGLPDRESDYAAEGNRLHKLMAGDTDKASEEDRGLVDTAKGWINKLVPDPSAVRLTIFEHPLEFEDLTGTPDVVRLMHDGSALVTDYKFGFLPVPPADVNLQLRAYAVLVAVSHHPTPSPIRVAIIQPRAKREEQVTLAEYGIEDLRNAALEIATIQGQSITRSAERVPGEDQCRYCRARSTDRCPESQALVQIERPAVGLPAIPGEELGRLANAAKVAEKVCDDILGETRRRLLADSHSVPGWTLEPAVPKRVIENPAAAFAVLVDHLTAAEFASCCDVGVGALDRAYWEAKNRGKEKRADRISQDKAKAEVTALLGEAVTKKQGAPMLKRSA